MMALDRIDLYVIRWARRKFKRLRRKTKGARDWFNRLRRANPMLFAHWQLCHGNGRTSGAVWIERFTYGSGSARRRAPPGDNPRHSSIARVAAGLHRWT